VFGFVVGCYWQLYLWLLVCTSLSGANTRAQAPIRFGESRLLIVEDGAPKLSELVPERNYSNISNRSSSVDSPLTTVSILYFRSTNLLLFILEIDSSSAAEIFFLSNKLLKNSE